MSLLHSSPRQAFKAHAHASSDLCPLCEQPIAQDLARRIEARQQEQQRAALEAARAEAEAQVEQAKASAQAEIAALKAAQDAAIEARVAERAASLEQEKAAAVLAERTKSFEETQALRQKLEDLTRKLEGKSAHELGEGSEIDLFEELRD